MECLLRCIAPPQGQGHALPAAGKTYAAIFAAEERRKSAQGLPPPAAIEAPLADLSIAEIGKPSSPLGLKMKQLQQQGEARNKTAPSVASTRSGSTYSSKSRSSAASGSSRSRTPLRATSDVSVNGSYMAPTASKAKAIEAAKIAETQARLAEERASKAMAEAAQKGMHFAMHGPGGAQLNPRRAPPSADDRQRAFEAARAAAAAAKADGGIKPGVHQNHKPRPVDPNVNSRRNTPVHSRSSSPANTYRSDAGSGRPFKPTVPFNGAPPPSFMAAIKSSTIVRPTRSGDGADESSDPSGSRIGPADQGRLNLERMRWDEKYA